MNRDTFNRLFDEAFEHAAKQVEHDVPESEQSWQRVQARLKQEQRRTDWRWRAKFIGIAAASMLIGACFLGNIGIIKAFQPFTETLKQFDDKMISLIIDTTDSSEAGALTPPPFDDALEEDDELPADGVELYETEISFEEADAATHFPFPAVDYIPEPYQLNKLIMTSIEKHSEPISFRYEFTANDSERERPFLLVKINVLQDNSSLSSGGPKNDMEVIQLADGEQAYLYDIRNGVWKLEYAYPSHHITILGKVSKEEIIKLANSIQYQSSYQ